MIPYRTDLTVRRKAVWGPKRQKAVWGPNRILGAVLSLSFVFAPMATAAPKATPVSSSQRVKHYKLDDELTRRIQRHKRGDTVDVIACLEPGQDIPARYKHYAWRGKFSIINCYALDGLPVESLVELSTLSALHRVHHNRRAFGQDLLSSVSVQADLLAQQYGYSGAGVTVAFIDSGITQYAHPDLEDSRILGFVDFAHRAPRFRSDENGHGTHVTGIVAGTGKLEAKFAGVAPGVSVVSLKVLDGEGKGSIGDTIAAMDWVAQHHARYNIRIVNMSVGAGVYESYWTDPLTLAAKALVDRGITVVAAAGNFGKNAEGELQWGGITAPGVAPWVLTTCAFSTAGTPDTTDDTVASFSSSGPTAFDFTAKPDICAPGVGIVSLAAPESNLYSAGALASPPWLIATESSDYGYAPYLSLSGTSQATSFVTGSVALMLQANPNLTPNLIKAILQYTATVKPNVSPLRQGGGFLNTLGAVSLAKFYAEAQPGLAISGDGWSRQIIWGNQLLSGGVLDPSANAWMPGVEWGWAQTQGGAGDNIVWGTQCSGGCDNIVWGTYGGDNIVWGTGSDDNIVWGTYGRDNVVWGTYGGDNIVWGTYGGDNVVWGTGFGDNIVWGTDCGGADCDNIVWGTAGFGDNIVWGTAGFGDNIVWGTYGGDNIVWGTGGDDNIVWGTSAGENVVWPINVSEGR